MFCSKCGTQLSDTAAFCNKCGAQVQTRQTTGNQNATKTYSNSGEGVTVQSQVQVVSNLSIPGVRIAALVIAVLTVCTSFMTWYEPSTTLTGSASLLNFASLFTDESASTISFAESYSLWTLPSLISNLSDLANIVGSNASDLSLLYIPLVLFVFGVVFVVVGIVKTFNRYGGKAALVWANLLFLAASIVYAAIYYIGLSDYVGGDTVAMLCAVFSFVGLVVSGVSEDPEQA